MMAKQLPIKKIYFNKPQLGLVTARAREIMANWPRGVGKSTVMAYILRKAAMQMPRSSGTITGCSYEQLLTKTLPSTLASLEKNFGYKKDVHYWIGHAPPKKLNIPKPFQAPLKYDHYITFATGAGAHLISQDRNSSPRGLNTDFQLTDEHLLLNNDKYNVEVLGTNRGNKEYFGNVPMHHGIFQFTSMPITTDGNNIIKKSEYYDEDGNDFTIIKNEIIRLQLEFLNNKDEKIRMEIHRAILDKEKKLKFYTCSRPSGDVNNGLYYSEATLWDNLNNVGLRWIEQQFREMIPELFLIEMLGKRNKKVVGGFYPTFNRDLHGYKGHSNNSLLESFDYDFVKIRNIKCEKDRDCVPELPLYISVDFGGKINTLVVAQFLQDKNQINFINNLFAKAPDEILDDVCEKFTTYYEGHPTKKVYFYYDRNGNIKTARSKITYADQVALMLRAKGWTVEMKSTGSNPFHNEKYLLLGRIFKQASLTDAQRDNRYPKVMFNLIQCKQTVISIEQAPAKENKGLIEKDKKSENSLILPQELATHPSDCVDNILFPLFKHLLMIITNVPYGRVM